ncbi:ABC transporter substrate-binding protein, partial [Mesorhizobium sp.]
EHPDYVVLRGWGVMNPVALKTAQKTGFPADHIIGNVWSNSEEDVIPAGDAAKGYTAITTQASGERYPVVQEIVKTVYGDGKGNLEDKSRIGSVYHNLGIVNGILNVEAVRIAQAKFGNRTLTGDEVRWGFEHLKLDPARVEALGAKDLFHSINVSWDNHEGDGYVTFQQWDGKKWNVVSDWIAPDWKLLRPIIEKSSEAYAKEKGIKIRTAEDADAVVSN